MENEDQHNHPTDEELQDAAFQEAVNASYRTLKRLRLRMNLSERRQRRSFERQLHLRHRYALDLFDHFLTASRDAGEKAHEARGRTAEAESDYTYFALARLHARACLTASEIRALVFSGHASGALARWRTLHELTVVAVFIKRNGAAAAERYFGAESVKTHREAVKFNQHCGSLGLDPLEPEVMEELKTEKEEQVHRFGEVMQEDWGWASSFLPNTPKRPNFAQIEKAVCMESWQPHVGMANHAVHGGSKGTLTDIGAGPFRYSTFMLTGASMRGLVVPVTATLQDLRTCTDTFIRYGGGVDDYVRAAVLLLYMLETRDAFIALEERLSEEESS